MHYISISYGALCKPSCPWQGLRTASRSLGLKLTDNGAHYMSLYRGGRDSALFSRSIFHHNDIISSSCIILRAAAGAFVARLNVWRSSESPSAGFQHQHTALPVYAVGMIMHELITEPLFKQTYTHTDTDTSRTYVFGCSWTQPFNRRPRQRRRRRSVVWCGALCCADCAHSLLQTARSERDRWFASFLPSSLDVGAVF